MGCLLSLKNLKKKYEKFKLENSRHNEHVSTTISQLQASRTLHSDPTILRTSMSSNNPINRVTNNRTRVSSTPSALDAAEQGALASIEKEEQEMVDVPARIMKEPHSPIPQPLPLPYPKGSSPLGLRMARSPLCSSGLGPDAAEQDGLETFQYEEKEWSKNQDTSMKGKRFSILHPLPLPPHQEISPMKAASSSKSGKAVDSVLYFQYDKIAAACHNFSIHRCMSGCLSSTIYKASFDHEASSKKLKATVTCLHQSTQGLREFINEVNNLATLQHPNLCKLLGFYASDSSEPRMLIYERLSKGSLDHLLFGRSDCPSIDWNARIKIAICARLSKGSLDHLLFGRSDGPSIDWNTRIKIAICAAQALTFLHEEGPLQAMYTDFSAANIQIDKDFNAKLSGYGFVGHVAKEELSRSSHAAANLSVETLEKGLLTPKSNVWSFGIVLLELFTGRKNFDRQFPKKERNLVKWCRPYLADDVQLSAIIDCQLKGQFSLKAARTLANIVQRCLQREPSERPTMRAILENLKTILDMEYPRLFPLQEPLTIYGRHMSRSPTADGIIKAPRLGFSPSLLPSATKTSISHPRGWTGVPTKLPTPLACSSAVSTEELTRQESTQPSSSVTNKA
ncbi:receptor-like protein kinase [Trifolium pratense]|uniref:Receptor-like protein kinase n=1 Tax=Trifolium pratense TaxID=57577 RepID=A0A2K3NLN5_TRIPR|nr:receptor-like protein kinase [Trifolium pratense]